MPTFAAMHARNRYRGPHDFTELGRITPELSAYLITTPDGRTSLDFTHPDAVKLLNQTLLLRDYGLKFWDVPTGSLVPGVPGRLDYIHLLAELMGDGARVPAKGQVANNQRRGLDIGTGASLIYPILGAKEYGWNFVATDVDEKSLKVASAIIKFNPGLQRHLELRAQANPKQIFTGIIRPTEAFDFTMCNPPFFADAAGAENAARQKWQKLGVEHDPGHNFGGRANELWTPGGEPAFLRRMILESADYGGQVRWFTTLVSKKGYLRTATQLLKQTKAVKVKVIPVGQGGKLRRVLAWRYA